MHIGSVMTATTLAMLAAPAVAVPYCEGDLCYSEFISPQQVAYRVAIPDTAVKGRPFDVLVQIVAPKSVGWAGIAWAGQMVNNPLTIAYSNGGAGAVASSRWASSKTAPTPYAGASYRVLPTSSTNDTHWRLDAVCSGCSAWQGGGLDPASSSAPLAWAVAARAPAQPESNSSSISIHTGKARIGFDLAAARSSGFNASVAAMAGTDEA